MRGKIWKIRCFSVFDKTKKTTKPQWNDFDDREKAKWKHFERTRLNTWSSLYGAGGWGHWKMKSYGHDGQNR